MALLVNKSTPMMGQIQGLSLRYPDNPAEAIAGFIFGGGGVGYGNSVEDYAGMFKIKVVRESDNTVVLNEAFTISGAAVLYNNNGSFLAYQALNTPVTLQANTSYTVEIQASGSFQSTTDAGATLGWYFGTNIDSGNWICPCPRGVGYAKRTESGVYYEQI